MGTVALTEATLRTDHRRERHRARRLVGIMVRAVPDVSPVFDAGSRPTRRHRFRQDLDETEQTLAGAAGICRHPGRSWPSAKAVLIFAQPGALPAPALEDLIAAGSRTRHGSRA